LGIEGKSAKGFVWSVKSIAASQPTVVLLPDNAGQALAESGS
jgi:hypothetical protein